MYLLILKADIVTSGALGLSLVNLTQFILSSSACVYTSNHGCFQLDQKLMSARTGWAGFLDSLVTFQGLL